MTSFFHGTFLLMGAVLLSKLLGFLYRMQFMRVAGEDADEARGDVVATHGGNALDALGSERADGGDDSLGNADARNVELAFGHRWPSLCSVRCRQAAGALVRRRPQTLPV